MAFDITLRDNGADTFDIAFGAAETTIERDAQVPASWGGTIFRDASAPAEFVGSLQRDAQVPAELGGLAQLFRDSNLPVEWLATPAPPVTEGNWIGVVGAAVWGPRQFSWREIPTPTGYERRPAEPERRRVRRRRRKPVPVAESQILVTAVNEDALHRSRALIRYYRRRLAQIDAQEAQRADEEALLALL